MFFIILLVPIFISFVFWYAFKREFCIAELVLPTVVVAIIYSIVSFAQEDNITTTEYNGHLTTEVRYYEYWSTWVGQTCSRQVACGEDCVTDSEGRRSCTTVYCTEYYDCSYCDYNKEYYQAVTNTKRTFPIDKAEYLRLKELWGNSTFLDIEDFW